MERPSAYIPMDRRLALLRNEAVAEHVWGTALFADISGFTPLTETLTQELGSQQGAEELTHHLNRVYDALIRELHRYGGCVMSFAGDAIICWFHEDDGQRAAACALAMQDRMARFTAVTSPFGVPVSLAMKTAVATGEARRFLVGDPNIQLIDVLAGSLLTELATTEKLANTGEVLLAPSTRHSLEDTAELIALRLDHDNTFECGVLTALKNPVADAPWPDLPPGTSKDIAIQPWLLPAIYERLQSGQGEFLAELRPVVIVFVRFEGIDYDHDPQAGHKLNEFISQAQRVLSRYDGALLHITFGDKGSYFSAGFGAPTAHEDDATRAVSAALALQTLAKSLDDISAIQIGVTSGRLRAGAYGSSQRRTYGIMGDAVNLAARLMQAAMSGQTLASQPVYQATQADFQWQALAPVRVKGKAQAIAVYELLNHTVKSARRLPEPDYALPMVGRAQELETIQQKIADSLAGLGQIIGITGEAGIGKSRLVDKAMALANEHYLIGHSGICQSFTTNSSYAVWESVWGDFFGLNPTAVFATQVSLLAVGLDVLDPALTPRLPLLGAVTNLSIPDNDLTRSFDAQLRKRSLESLLVECLRIRAEQQPLFIVLEDCQWIDVLSAELLEEIGRAIQNLPVLLILSYRASERHSNQPLSVTQLPNFTELALAEFSLDDARDLIKLKLAQFEDGSMDTAVSSSPAIFNHIIARAQGNPFYIEELLNYLHDRQIDLHDLRTWHSIDLPTSLHSLILSRIDRLTESQKGVIKVASVIGRLFSAAMLWGAYPQLGNADDVMTDLQKLHQMELTLQEQAEPELTYLFKNMMTQEVAYEILPYAMRAALHELIGHYLEQNFADDLSLHFDLLAHHYGRSQNSEKKRHYLLAAGSAAQANYANQAAIDYYQQALPLLTPDEQIAIKLKLGEVLQLTGRWPEAGLMFQQAVATAEQLADLPQQAWCEASLSEHLRKLGQFDEAEQRLAKAKQYFEQLYDQAGVGQVLHYAGTLAAQKGESGQSEALFQQSLAIRRSLNDKENIANLLNNLGILARRRGDYDAAHTFYGESLQIREEMGNKWAIAISLSNLGFMAIQEGKFALARQQLERSVALLREVGDRWYLANALNNLANAAREQLDFAAANRLYHESLRINQSLGDKGALAFLLEDVSVLLLNESQVADALTLYEAAKGIRRETAVPLPNADQQKLATLFTQSISALPPLERQTAVTEGQAMALETAVQFALTATYVEGH